MGKGFIGGALLVGLFSWAPFDSSLPLFMSIKTTYVQVLNGVAEWFFGMGW